MRHLIHITYTTITRQKIDLTETGSQAYQIIGKKKKKPTNLIDLPTLIDNNPVYFSARQVDFSSVVHRNFLFCANFSINFNS